VQAVIALTRIGGVASHAELVNAVGRSALRTAVDAGLIVRAATGTYCVPDADRARLSAVKLNGALALTSAALAHGWKVKDPPSCPAVCVPRGRRVAPDRRSGIDVRWGELTEPELRRRRTDPARTVIDCARFLPFDAALAVADSALRSGDVGPIGLMEAAELAPRTGRARAIRVVRAATPEAANPMESVLRAICLGIDGLDVHPQQWIGEVGRADLVDTDRRLVIEAESMEFHGSLDGYRRDVRRYTDFVGERHLVLRFCWEDIMLAPERVAASIVGTLNWWPPPPSRHAVGAKPHRISAR
jgi:very-short-patch-repair endonuclease